MKTINIKFTFTDEEWWRFGQHYSEKDIRMGLREAGMAEMDLLLKTREEAAERAAQNEQTLDENTED